MQKFRL